MRIKERLTMSLKREAVLYGHPITTLVRSLSLEHAFYYSPGLPLARHGVAPS